MKPVREDLRYDRPVEEVLSLISTGAFQLEVVAHLGGRDGEVVEESARPGGGIKLVTRQRTGVELPGFAKKLIPADTAVTQTYEWEPAGPGGVRYGTWSAAVRGAPISMGGHTELRSDGGGCIHVYAGQVKASVPVVGGRLESFALENLERELARTRDFTAARLAG